MKYSSLVCVQFNTKIYYVAELVRLSIRLSAGFRLNGRFSGHIGSMHEFMKVYCFLLKSVDAWVSYGGSKAMCICG